MLMNVATISAMNVTNETIKEIRQMVSVVFDGLSSPFMAAIISFMEAKMYSAIPPRNTHLWVFSGVSTPPRATFLPDPR